MRVAVICIAAMVLLAVVFSLSERQDGQTAPPAKQDGPKPLGVSKSIAKPAKKIVPPTVAVRQPEPAEPKEEPLAAATMPAQVKLPEDFPEELPIFADATLTQTTPMPNNAQNVVFLTTEPVQKVSSFYRTNMTSKGFRITQEFERDGHAFATYEKDNLQIHVTVAADDRYPGQKAIALMYERIEDPPFDF